jgi:2-keto-myo-inositol isomerase
MGNWQLGLNGDIAMTCGLAEEIAIAGQLGYDWLEIRDAKLEAFLKERSLEDLRALFAEAKVKPLAIGGIMSLASGAQLDRETMEQQAEWRLRMAGAIGCECVVVYPTVGAGDAASGEDRHLLVESLQLISDIAVKYGVRVAYEFIAVRSTPVHGVASTMALLDSVGRANVGWLFDFYHFHVADGSLDALAKADASRLLLVHIDDVKDLPYEALASMDKRLFPGEGTAATASILHTLHQIGYQGPFSVELWSKEYSTWDPWEFARVARDKTLAVLEKYYA